MATFADLQKKDQVTAEELKTTLREYADGGWVISGPVVVGLINRATLTDVDKAELLVYAKRGIEKQKRVCYTLTSKEKNSAEYEQVSRYLSR